MYCCFHFKQLYALQTFGFPVAVYFLFLFWSLMCIYPKSVQTENVLCGDIFFMLSAWDTGRVPFPFPVYLHQSDRTLGLAQSVRDCRNGIKALNCIWPLHWGLWVHLSCQGSLKHFGFSRCLYSETSQRATSCLQRESKWERVTYNCMKLVCVCIQSYIEPYYPLLNNDTHTHTQWIQIHRREILQGAVVVYSCPLNAFTECVCARTHSAPVCVKWVTDHLSGMFTNPQALSLLTHNAATDICMLWFVCACINALTALDSNLWNEAPAAVQASSDAEQEMISIIIVMMMMMMLIKRHDEGVMNKDPFCSILGCQFGPDDENTATMMKMIILTLIRRWRLIFLPVKMMVWNHAAFIHLQINIQSLENLWCVAKRAHVSVTFSVIWDPLEGLRPEVGNHRMQDTQNMTDTHPQSYQREVWRILKDFTQPAAAWNHNLCFIIQVCVV